MEQNQTSDLLSQGLTMDAKVRTIVVDIPTVIQQAIDKHSLNRGSAEYLAQATIGALLLSSQIKGEERLTIQLESTKPTCRIICDINADGGVRAKITPTQMEISHGNPTLDGFLVTIKHNQKRELYRGATEIKEEKIEQALEHHLNQSSQIECKIRILTKFDTDGTVLMAKGLLIEKYPFSEENPSATSEEFQAAYSGFHQVTDEEFNQELKEKDVFGHPIFDLENKNIHWHCGCSEERIDTMLISIGPDELESILEELGQVEVTCEYCSTQYVRDAIAIQALIDQATYI